jgi:hypothetical protein
MKKDEWDEVVELDDGWSIAHNEGGYWYVCSPAGYPVRTPAFLDKDGAISGYPKERRLYEWETGVMRMALK